MSGKGSGRRPGTGYAEGWDAIFGKKQPKEYAWECNECGSQEYTMCVSYEDACHMGCAGCGSDEFHKVEVKED